MSALAETGFRAPDSDVIPDGAKSFVKSLHRLVKNGGSKNDLVVGSSGKPRHELQHLYEEVFNKHTERYFKTTAWPSAENMAQFIEEDESVLVLYKELYFRHIYARLTPTVDDKFDSFQNYVELFNLLLGLNSSDAEFELPTSWLWDIIDEFIYQFQTFHLFRNKVSQLTPDEVAMLKENEHMWSAQTVLQYLHALVRKAGIDLTKKAAEQPAVEATEETPAVSGMFKTLGYFSLVGLLRVNALLCDYQSALKSLDPVDLRQHRSIFTSALPCHVSLYYFMGLSYLLSRRFVDAIKVFTYFLTYIQRNKHLIPRSYQAEVIQKRVDQMTGLLAIAYVLSGAAGTGAGYDRDSGAAALIDENLYHEMRDKLDEKLDRMKRGELSAFEEVLSSSAPKFLTVSAPNYDAGLDVHTAALAMQLSIFLSEVKQRAHINDLHSYLKLFTTLSISKLAVFLKLDEEATQALLLKLAHKNRSQRWIGGAPGDCVWQTFNEINFTLHDDTIHVHEQRAQRRYGDFFIRQSYKFSELTADVKAINVARR